MIKVSALGSRHRKTFDDVMTSRQNLELNGMMLLHSLKLWVEQ